MGRRGFAPGGLHALQLAQSGWAPQPQARESTSFKGTCRWLPTGGSRPPPPSAPEELPFPFFDSWPSRRCLAAQGSLKAVPDSCPAPGPRGGGGECRGGRGCLVTGVSHPPSRSRGNGVMAEPAGRAQGPVSPWGHRCSPGGSPRDHLWRGLSPGGPPVKNPHFG